MERFGAQLDRPVRELSTGTGQKLGLVQAFAGLDPLVQQSFHALLGEVAAEGRTVFLSSHTLSEVERVADRGAILRRGRLVVVDSRERLRAVAIRCLEVELGGEVPPVEEIHALPGVREASLHGARLEVSSASTTSRRAC
ncbi:MAG: transporter [Conexibacter sp.]|nr:transporter [Conexibacter sp.]